MGIKRPIDTEFWTDRKVVEMFSPEDKLFFLYILTNPHTTQLGIYEISPKQMAWEIGYSVEAVKVLIDRFEQKYHLIKFSPETSEIAIKNALRHNIVKGGKPVEDCILKEISKVKDRSLLSFIYDSLIKADNLNQSVQKILPVIKENVNDNDNDNDNDNERIVHESSTNRQNVADEPYQQIKDAVLGEKEKADKVCEWCGCKTTVLHRHHYPIPKRLGGTKTVNICSNCHAEFHKREAKEFGSTDTNLTKKQTDLTGMNNAKELKDYLRGNC